MSYRFLEDEATADVAFEAEGKSLREVMESSAQATTNVMVRDLNSVKNVETVEFDIKDDTPEMTLFNLLQEIIFYKDADMLLLSKFELDVSDDGKSVHCKASGEKIDENRHPLVVDVKAVTLHEFELKEDNGTWKAHVILDI